MSDDGGDEISRRLAWIFGIQVELVAIISLAEGHTGDIVALQIQRLDHKCPTNTNEGSILYYTAVVWVCPIYGRLVNLGSGIGLRF